MPHPIIMSYNSTSITESKFVHNLADYLNSQRIYIEPYDPNVAAQRMNQQLISAKWFIVILTPGAIQSRQVQTLVSIAFNSIKQGQLQGVLALTIPSNPIELDDLPPLWSTMRIYYTGERNEDFQRTFEKLYRTLDDNRATVPGASTSNNNWAYSAYNSAAFRPQTTTRRTTQGSQSRLFIPLVTGLALIIFFLALVLSKFILFSNPPATPTINANKLTHVTSTTKGNKNPTSHVHGKVPVTQNPSVTATAPSQLPSLSPSELYTAVMNNPPTYTMDAQDPKQNWDQQTSLCPLIHNMYVFQNGPPSEYSLCVAHGINLKNFAYKVAVTFSNTGDVGGLYFRAKDDLSFYYRLSLDATGRYSLYECQACIEQNSHEVEIGTPEKVSINPLEQANTVTIIALNTVINLYINGIFVKQFDGSAVTGRGEIGLYAVIFDQSSIIRFSDVKVWNLDSSQIG